MSMPAAREPENFDCRLNTASTMIGTSVEKLISLKIRPIEEVGDVQVEWISPTEYPTTINRALKESNIRVHGDADAILHNEPILCELSTGEKFVYVKHESGPELILAIDFLQHAALAFGAAAVAGNQLVSLLNNLHKYVKAASSRRRGPGGPTSIETRMKSGQKVLKQFSKTATVADKAIDSVTELLE